MTHRRVPDPDERTPEWLIGLLIAIVLVTAGWFFLRSVGAGDNPVLVDDGQAEAAPWFDVQFVRSDGTPASSGDRDGLPIVDYF